MKRRIFSLRRLRWKLTLNYTLVAVVTLLVMELFVASLATAFLNSDFLPSLVVQQSKDSVAADLEPYLEQDPPDTEGLRQEIDSFFELDNSGSQGADDSPSARDEPGNEVDVFLDPGQGAMFVVDDERELLAASPRVEGFTEGGRFQAGRINGLPPILSCRPRRRRGLHGALRAHARRTAPDGRPARRRKWGRDRGRSSHLQDAEPRRTGPYHRRRCSTAAPDPGRHPRRHFRLPDRLGHDPAHRAPRPRRRRLEPGRLLREVQGPFPRRAWRALRRAKRHGRRPRKPPPDPPGTRHFRGPQPLRPRPARLRKTAGLRNLHADSHRPRPHR